MPSQLFSFTKYFKKDSSSKDSDSGKDTDKDTADAQQTSVSVSHQETTQTQSSSQTSQPAQTTTYSGIGNPPGGQAYSGIGNPPQAGQTTSVKTTVTKTASDSPIQDKEAVKTQDKTSKVSTTVSKTSDDQTPQTSIDMGKRVGMDVLSRLTQRANTTLIKSVNKVKELKLQNIDTEHVLWGLLQDASIYQLVSDCKAVPSEIQTTLEKNFKKGKYKGNPQFSPRVKRVLELSLKAARSLGYEFISPEHILLALSYEGEGVAAQVLTKFHLTKEVLSQKITGKKDLEQKKEDKKTTSLEQFTDDLTAKAARGELDPVVGRSWEIERIIHILSRRTKNNPCLIGDAGVGKTAIVEGLAQRIAHGDVPEPLLHKRILLLDLMSLIAGARHRGEFEERLKNLIKEVKAAAGAIILFIDELHNMVGAGSGSEGTMDASNILKPSLARGELQVIGTTTITEYRKYIEKDPALERRFQPVMVSEPTADTAIEMVTALRDKYEAFHRVKIPDEAIEAAVRLSQRYIADRYLPDKAVDLIDEASAAVRLPAISLPEEIKSSETKLKKANHELEEADKMGDAVRMEALKKEIEEEEQNLEKLKETYQTKKSTTTNSVSPEVIAETVSRWTNIPVSRLTESEAAKLMELESIIHKRLIDQDEAVSAVAEAVRRGRAGLKSNKRPIGSFIFMGPTGVGKTELAKSLAELLFGSEEMMVRLDMTEYMEKHEVAKLIGAPPGYVGYEEGGQLTEAVRRRPYSVVLLDEIEKAHPDVFNILIQLLDDGRLTDNKGRTISFKNSIVICTSNLGSGIIQEEMLSWNLSEGVKELTPEKAQSLKIFRTYVVSPTGREMLTLDENYWAKQPQDEKWKKGDLKDYFAGSVVTGMNLQEGEMLFPEEGFDSHAIAPDGSESITKDDRMWFRTSTTAKEWRLSTILDQLKGHNVINALPDNPEQQLPTAKFDSHAISLTNREIISLGDRFWQRDNLQIKDWTTGNLKEYFANATLTKQVEEEKTAPQDQKGGKKDETAGLIKKRDKKENLSFPESGWNVHFFKPTGEEIIVSGKSFWMRKNSTSSDWVTGPLEKLFTTIEVVPETNKTKEVKAKDKNTKDATAAKKAAKEEAAEPVSSQEEPEPEKQPEEEWVIPVKPEGKKEETKEGEDKFEVLSKRLMEELRKFFRPELLNRFDEVVIFRPLSRENMLEIVDLQLRNLKKLLEEQDIAIAVTPYAKALLTEIGFDPIFGARPLRRTIQREIENPISSFLIKGELAAGDTIEIDYDGESLKFNIKKMQVKPALSPKSEESITTSGQKETAPEEKAVVNPNVTSYQCKSCGHVFEVPKGSTVSSCPKCQSPSVAPSQPPEVSSQAPPSPPSDQTSPPSPPSSEAGPTDQPVPQPPASTTSLNPPTETPSAESPNPSEPPALEPPSANPLETAFYSGNQSSSSSDNPSGETTTEDQTLTASS